MDPKLVLAEFVDYLSPRLDTYEQAIYLYAMRHSRLEGREEIVIGFKSARKRLAMGSGEKGKPMAEGTCYEKLRSLQDKGCLRILGTEREGTRLRINLPSEMDGLIPPGLVAQALSLEEMDFFAVPANRAAILRREGGRCFYCLRAIAESNFVIEHVVSRPAGTNSYSNVVAACIGCNNRKGDVAAEDFLRRLYREGFLNEGDLEARLNALRQLRAGEMRPVM
jgi:hypothetical protein